jgi:hypothetical protein
MKTQSFQGTPRILVATRKQPTPRLAPLTDIPTEEEEVATVESSPPSPPPLKLAKRYFHILGIDIIIDSNLNPQVLELNDRPSLGVTVEFEKDLKESIIADAFEHVCPNGDVRGNSPGTSRWTQIFPFAQPGSQWGQVVARILNPALPEIEIPRHIQQVTIRKPRVELGKSKKNKKKKGKKGGKKRSSPTEKVAEEEL